VNKGKRLLTYSVAGGFAVVAWLTGLTPLITQNKAALNEIGMIGVGICVVPFLIFRSTRFYQLVGHPDRMPVIDYRIHQLMFRLMVTATAIAIAAMVVGYVQGSLVHWKNATLLGALFFFHAAGWLLKAPTFAARLRRAG
jgi:hypothetical protein